ncbi:MAG: hypothetical protein QM532_02595 [Cyanobium sp. MAG06]|nr:hypothetical protein [Cyanobium sp. MAG06]
MIGNGYADLSSVHFAKDVVMDSMYGGEMGNEIFFAYPEVFISSQMTTNKESLSYEGSFDQHNDV